MQELLREKHWYTKYVNRIRLEEEAKQAIIDKLIPQRDPSNNHNEEMKEESEEARIMRATE